MFGERCPGKIGIHTDLTVVEGADNGYVVHVIVENCSHLGFLDGRNATLGVEYEDGNIGFVAKSIYGRAVTESDRSVRR